MMIYVCAISPASIRNDRFLGSPVVTLLLMLRDCRALLSMTLSALHKWYQLIINHLALLPWTNKKAHCGVMFANDIHVCNISKYDFAYSSHDSVLCFVMWLSCDAVFSWEVPKHQNAKTPWGNRFWRHSVWQQSLGVMPRSALVVLHHWMKLKQWPAINIWCQRIGWTCYSTSNNVFVYIYIYIQTRNYIQYCMYRTILQWYIIKSHVSSYCDCESMISDITMLSDSTGLALWGTPLSSCAKKIHTSLGGSINIH